MNHPTTADKGELLPLPEPTQWFIDVTTNGRSTGRYEVCAEEYRDSEGVVPLFTAEQMREYAIANRSRPNNEGQDGLTDSEILTDAHRYCCKYVHADDAPYRFTERGIIEFVNLRITRHLSSKKASPAEVGDLNSVFESDECQDAGHRRGWFGIAEFIWHRALNQRLAVKGGEAVAWYDPKADAVITESHRKYLAEHYPKHELTLTTPLYANPVSDDRQAKDAAMLREALQYMVEVCPAINSQGEEAHERACLALSATKREEV